MRRWATPQSVRNHERVQPTPDVLDQARAHYADHCATCHANDGSGDTEMGRAFTESARLQAPRRIAHRRELFSIIEHGIRLTGMPGWGMARGGGA